MLHAEVGNYRTTPDQRAVAQLERDRAERVPPMLVTAGGQPVADDPDGHEHDRLGERDGHERPVRQPHGDDRADGRGPEGQGGEESVPPPQRDDARVEPRASRSLRRPHAGESTPPPSRTGADRAGMGTIRAPVRNVLTNFDTMRPVKLIPLYDETADICCTITDAEIPARIALIDEMRTALVGLERTEHGMLLRFPADAAIEAKVRQFAVDEKRCCEFWGFGVTVDDNDAHAAMGCSAQRCGPDRPPRSVPVRRRARDSPPGPPLARPSGYAASGATRAVSGASLGRGEMRATATENVAIQVSIANNSSP